MKRGREREKEKNGGKVIFKYSYQKKKKKKCVGPRKHWRPNGTRETRKVVKMKEEGKKKRKKK